MVILYHPLSWGSRGNRPAGVRAAASRHPPPVRPRAPRPPLRGDRSPRAPLARGLSRRFAPTSPPRPPDLTRPTELLPRCRRLRALRAVRSASATVASAPLRGSVCPAPFPAFAARVLRNPRDAPAGGGAHGTTSGRSLPPLRLHAPPSVRSAATAQTAAPHRPTGGAFRLRYGRFRSPSWFRVPRPFSRLRCSGAAQPSRRSGGGRGTRNHFGSLAPSATAPRTALRAPLRCCSCCRRLALCVPSPVVGLSRAIGRPVFGRRQAATRPPSALAPRARRFAATAPPAPPSRGGSPAASRRLRPRAPLTRPDRPADPTDRLT